MQLQAGFTFEAVKKEIENRFGEKAKKMLFNLSHFELDGPFEIKELRTNIENPVLAVANNIISRGLPTRPSYNLENYFAHISNFLVEEKNLGSKLFVSSYEEHLVEKFWKALHIIDPRINPENISIDYENSFEKLGSKYEEDFLLKEIPKILGNYFLQIVESQRYLNELLNTSEENQDETLSNNFKEQRVDFSIDFPYKFDKSSLKGLIIEIDGEQHKTPAQKLLDEKRDKAVIKSNFDTIRIRTEEWAVLETLLKSHSLLKDNEEYFKILKENYSTLLSDEWIDVVQFILSPFGIARIQKTLLELISQNILKFSDHLWRICIIERDVTCGNMAIEDFQELVNNLFLLAGINQHLPKIELVIYSTDEFINHKLHNNDFNVKNINSVKSDEEYYDLVLDVSVLQRSRISSKIDFKLPPKNYFKIRSSHSVRSKRKVYCSDLIVYPELVDIKENGRQDPKKYYENILEYFLLNIFRKEKFKLGQIQILNRALSLNSVVGLLPTGGGKSLTYQLAALLQPGMVLIIDPIKSLMKDQVDGLKKNLIDNTEYLNSSKRGRERIETMKRISSGVAQYIFVSPERLLMKEFRDILESLAQKQFYFSYAIIDEAHCVSEWGHDFRTSYLMLGKNVIKYCKTNNNNYITIFGLTATASFDVLTDILREMSTPENILDAKSIIRYETTNRPEIQYEVIKVEIDKGSEENEFDTKIKLGKKKQIKINELLSEIPNQINNYLDESKIDEIFNDAYINDVCNELNIQTENFDKNQDFRKIVLNNYDHEKFYNEKCDHAGMIFCPHRSFYFGVTDKYKKKGRNLGVANNIYGDNYFIGTFIGTDEKSDQTTREIENDNIKNQDGFINDKLNLMVCTKAFGMGIDKPNIRFSIHLNYPSSIESFIQESGRIGRDGKMALAYIIYNDQEFEYQNNKFEIDYDINHGFHEKSLPGVEKEKKIIRELLSEVTFPICPNYKEIEQQLNNEDYGVDLTLWPTNNPTRLYINGLDSEQYGFIYLTNLESNFKDVDDKNEAEEIHNFIKDYIRENKPKDQHIINFLKKENLQPPEPGIESLLKDNEKADLDLSAENDHESIFKQIRKEIQDHLNLDTIVEAFDKSSNCDKFIISLKQNLTQDQKDNIKNFYNQIRTKQYTEKAIYRLSIIGIIEDYEVDYRTSTYTLKLRRLPDEQIRENIINHLRLYYSEQRVNEEIKKIDLQKTKDSNNFLHKSIAFLIDFIYREIAKKRHRAIDDMKKACEYRIKSSNTVFKDYIYYYFNSKYARKNYEEDGKNVSLYDRLYDENDLPKDNADNIELIFEFIEIAGNTVDNLRHLRGACIRLLQLQPDYFSLYLLKSYSVFIIENKKDLILQDEIKDFLTGMNKYYDLIKYDNIKFFNFIDSFTNEIKRQTENKLNKVIELAIESIKIKAHTEWLKKTNKKLGAKNGK